MARRLVITGAGGQVGRFLAGEGQRRGYDVSALTRADLDIADAAAADARIRGGDVVVNCAAFTNVDAAEADPEGAHAINAVGAGNVARACARAGARMVHISTDYVFSGGSKGGQHRPYEIDDPTGPLGVYGRSKLDGEHRVLDALPGAHVVRTSWVYTGSAGGGDFVAVMRRLAAGAGTVDVVDDQTGSPTYTGDLVAALFEVVERDIRPGILHVTNAGGCSRFDQARAVFAESGADPERVRPVDTAASNRPARRPVYSVLSMDGSVRAGLSRLRPWRDALAEAVAQP